LREGLFEITSGGQRGDRVSVRELFDDGEGTLANGAGGTENGEFFQGELDFPLALIIALPIAEKMSCDTVQKKVCRYPSQEESDLCAAPR
jgi:hypothetical protein